jgi:hypothetical protein
MRCRPFRGAFSPFRASYLRFNVSYTLFPKTLELSLHVFPLILLVA